MKRPISYLLLLLVFISCKNENKLTFEPYRFTTEKCNECPLVSIAIPEAISDDVLSTIINTSLQEEIISLLIFDDAPNITSVSDAAQSFKNAFLLLQKTHSNESLVWEAKIDGKISYENENLISLELHAYIFTGGAHGYTVNRFLNFDKAKGRILENWELFKDGEAFETFVEDRFRKQEAIPLDMPINTTGLMFDENIFYLPENIGFTEKGLELRYEQYEISSFADGPIMLTLPLSEAQNYLTVLIPK